MRNRVCPGKSLALVVVQSFLGAWFAVEDSFSLSEAETKKIVFGGSPTTKPGGFKFEVVAA